MADGTVVANSTPGSSYASTDIEVFGTIIDMLDGGRTSEGQPESCSNPYCTMDVTLDGGRTVTFKFGGSTWFAWELDEF